MELDIVLYVYFAFDQTHSVAIKVDHKKRYAVIINDAVVTNHQWQIKRSNYNHVIKAKHYLLLKYED
jgi:hypothetical protein